MPTLAIIETVALQVLGVVMVTNKENIDHFADNVAGKIVAAVKDSETQVDDFAANAAADLLTRIADGVKAGLAAPTE